MHGARAEATESYAAANLSRLPPVLAALVSSLVSTTKYVAPLPKIVTVTRKKLGRATHPTVAGHMVAWWKSDEGETAQAIYHEK